MANINSFSENMRQLVVAQTNSLNILNALQSSMTTNSVVAQFTQQDTQGNYTTYQIPSYAALTNRMEALERSISNLINGRSTVSLTDGTYREIKLTDLAKAPAKITSIENPSTFQLDTNWFFESLMYPGATITIDLTDQVEDSADRARVKRIILDSTDAAASNIWTNTISGSSLSYQQLITALTLANVTYSEDEETVEFPLTQNTAVGDFVIDADPVVENGKIWYTLDTVTYSTVSTTNDTSTANNILTIGDQLGYDGTILEIIEINTVAKRVRFKYISGTNEVGMNAVLYYYQDPFRKKELKVRFGAHEYNILYVKGVQESYNLLGNLWSEPIMFFTDDLRYTDNTNIVFNNFYNDSIVDWGADMIAEAKEKNIKAYFGMTPNAPTLNLSDLRVVQINTQINAALDNTDIKSTASDIESTKSQINSLKSTIAAQKTDLQNITTVVEYNSLQQQIDTNTTQLDSLQTQYSSLIKYLQNAVKDNSAVTADPKYHVRGFFDIPALQVNDASTAEEIIGFDIAYRYIKEDNTGVELKTFDYSSTTGGTLTGTFTDWNITQSALKEKEFNSSTGLYEWKTENAADGSEVNINQIDIPITKGEKVEIKARSISEAGWPSNCLKSGWSNSVIVEFPSTLTTSNEIADLIKETNDDAISLTVNNTLKSLGVITHLDDTVQNTGSATNLYYKHLSKNIGYEYVDPSTNTVTTQTVQYALDNVINTMLSITENQVNYIDTVIKNTLSTYLTTYDTQLVVVTDDISGINKHLAIVDTSIAKLEKEYSALNTTITENDTAINTIKNAASDLEKYKTSVATATTTSEEAQLAAADALSKAEAATKAANSASESVTNLISMADLDASISWAMDFVNGMENTQKMYESDYNYFATTTWPTILAKIEQLDASVKQYEAVYNATQPTATTKTTSFSDYAGTATVGDISSVSGSSDTTASSSATTELEKQIAVTDSSLDKILKWSVDFYTNYTNPFWNTSDKGSWTYESNLLASIQSDVNTLYKEILADDGTSGRVNTGLTAGIKNNTVTPTADSDFTVTTQLNSLTDTRPSSTANSISQKVLSALDEKLKKLFYKISWTTYNLNANGDDLVRRTFNIGTTTDEGTMARAITVTDTSINIIATLLK